MHPGYENPDVVGPSGPDRSAALRPQRRPGRQRRAARGDGELLDALLRRGRRFHGRLLRGNGPLSRGSGRIGSRRPRFPGHERRSPLDGLQPAKDPDITRTKYAKGLADLATKARESIVHHADLPLAMAEAKLELGRRLPSPERLAWARPINAARGDAVPKSKEEVYAEQANGSTPIRRPNSSSRPCASVTSASPPFRTRSTGSPLEAENCKVPSPRPSTSNSPTGPKATFPRPSSTNSAATRPGPPAPRTRGNGRTEDRRDRPDLARNRRRETRAAASPMAIVPTPRHPDRPTHRLLAAQRSHRPEPSRGFRKKRPRPGRTASPSAFRCAKKRRSHLGGAGKANPFTIGDINRAAHVAGGRLHAPMPDLGKTYSVELWFWNDSRRRPRRHRLSLLPRSDGDKSALGRASRHRRQSQRRSRR